MLDTLDLNLSLDQQTYDSQIEDLMRQLRHLQRACWEEKLTIIVVLEGWAAAGKGTLVKKITNYMDPRGFDLYPVLAPTPEENQYPFLWRFWQKLPRRGSIAFFYHSWYTHLLEDRLFKKLPDVELPTVIRQVNVFERQLVEDGVAIAKFWVHISQKELKSRLKKYDNNELQAWRVRKEDWQQSKHYKEYANIAEEMLSNTSTGASPWTLVEGDCKRWARVKVLTQLVAIMTETLDRKRLSLPKLPSLPAQVSLLPTEPNFLAQVDLSLQFSQKDYKKKLSEAQVELRQLQLKIYEEQIPVLIMFEGWDAAGKGGAIKRLTDILDPRSYKVHAFAAPTQEELQHQYLWRFWQRIPAKGTIAIFDRSWYGRVLVERIEGFASDLEWRRAYQEINEFEANLTSAGYVIVKFWLHISPEEQLNRFQTRQDDPFKQYKLTQEDWRNREKWPIYEVAVNQAVARTNTPTARWTIVPANDKYYARVHVIETVINAIKAKLNQ